MSVADKIASLKASLPSGVTLVAVSKTYPPSAIMEAYEAGQRVFGENRPQELAAKQAELPGDIEAAFSGQLLASDRRPANEQGEARRPVRLDDPLGRVGPPASVHRPGGSSQR